MRIIERGGRLWADYGDTYGHMRPATREEVDEFYREQDRIKKLLATPIKAPTKLITLEELLEHSHEEQEKQARKVRDLRRELKPAAEIISKKLTKIVREFGLPLSPTETESIVANKLTNDETLYLLLDRPTPTDIANCFFDGIIRTHRDESKNDKVAITKWLGNFFYPGSIPKETKVIDLAAYPYVDSPAYHYERLWQKGRDYAFDQQLADQNEPEISEETMATWHEAEKQGYQAQWDLFKQQNKKEGIKKLISISQLRPPPGADAEPNTHPITMEQLQPPPRDSLETSELVSSTPTNRPQDFDKTWAGVDPLAIPGRYLERMAIAPSASRPNLRNSCQ